MKYTTTTVTTNLCPLWRRLCVVYDRPPGRLRFDCRLAEARNAARPFQSPSGGDWETTAGRKPRATSHHIFPKKKKRKKSWPKLRFTTTLPAAYELYYHFLESIRPSLAPEVLFDSSVGTSLDLARARALRTPGREPQPTLPGNPKIKGKKQNNAVIPFTNNGKCGIGTTTFDDVNPARLGC